jgi:acetyl esterase/lipase
MLWSPWVHVTAQAAQDYTNSKHADIDVLAPELLQWGVDDYFPKCGPSNEVIPYISPLHHAFKTRVPFFVHTGAAEALYETNQEFAQEMAGLNGQDRVKLHETEGAWHDLIYSDKGLGMEEQLRVALEDARELFLQHSSRN